MFETFRKWFNGLSFVQNEHDKFANANKSTSKHVPTEMTSRTQDDVKKRAEEARPSAYGFYKAAPTSKPKLEAVTSAPQSTTHVHTSTCSHHAPARVVRETYTQQPSYVAPLYETTTIIEEDDFVDQIVTAIAIEAVVDTFENVIDSFCDDTSILGDDW